MEVGEYQTYASPTHTRQHQPKKNHVLHYESIPQLLKTVQGGMICIRRVPLTSNPKRS